MAIGLAVPSIASGIPGLGMAFAAVAWRKFLLQKPRRAAPAAAMGLSIRGAAGARPWRIRATSCKTTA